MDMIFNDGDISQALDAEEALLAQAEGSYVVKPSSVLDRVITIAEFDGQQAGESLPWSKADSIQRLRAGELSVWAGINGHGKSLLLGQIMLWRMKTQSVLIASLEMKPEETLYRMACQYAGCNASPGFCETAMEKFDGRLWIYDQLDTVKASRVLALVHYAAKTLKVDHIVIDSLTKCGFGTDDYTGQKDFIDRLQWAAKRHGVHIHLVCHVRKTGSELDEPDKFSIRGGAELSDIPDNVFIVFRNKRKEQTAEKLRATGMVANEAEQSFLDQPDTFLKVDKNRHGSREGRIGLFYHASSGQFVPSDGPRAMNSPF